MAAIAIHVAIALGQAAVGHQDRDLVQAFRRQRPEIPHRGRAAQIGLGIALLGADEIREFIGVANKKHRGVVADQVPIAVLGIVLHGKAAHVALGIGRAAFAGHGRKAPEALGLFADLAEYLRLGPAGDVAGDRQGAVGARPLGMHDPLGDSLAIEMGVLFKKLPILHQQRSARAGGQAVLVVADGDARGGGQLGLRVHSTLLGLGLDWNVS